MTTSHDQREYTHSAVAHRGDPESTVTVSGVSPHEVEGLQVTLRLTPPGYFTLEAKAMLFVPASEHDVDLRVVLDGPTGATRSPWRTFSRAELDVGMVQVTYAFVAIRGTGDALTVRLQLRTTGDSATYSVGALSALAIPSAGLSWLPGVGLTLPLNAGSAMRQRMEHGGVR